MLVDWVCSGDAVFLSKAFLYFSLFGITWLKDIVQLEGQWEINQARVSEPPTHFSGCLRIVCICLCSSCGNVSGFPNFFFKTWGSSLQRWLLGAVVKRGGHPAVWRWLSLRELASLAYIWSVYILLSLLMGEHQLLPILNVLMSIFISLEPSWTLKANSLKNPSDDTRIIVLTIH